MKLLHAKILGTGQPLLILHGYFGMSDNWKTLGNEFAKYFQVHLIDQRNHGRSFHHQEFSYQHMVDDLLYYCKHYQLENVVLLGHSMGGKTAMLFAVTHADLVNRLIVADIAPKAYKPHHNEILAALNSIDFSKHTTRKLIDKELQKLIPELGVRQFLLKNVYWREKGILDFRFNLASLTQNNFKIGAALPTNTSFRKPSLFLSGGKSGYITENDTALINTHFPNATIETIADAGHWLHAEKPKDFLETVLRFLKQPKD